MTEKLEMFFQIQTDEGINLYGEEMIKVCTLLKPKIPGKVKVVMFLWKFGSKASSITTISHLSLMSGMILTIPFQTIYKNSV